MAKNDILPPEELRKLLRYDADTGKLYSLKTGKEVFTNTHHAGYKKGAIRYKTYTAHRICMAIVLNEWPNGEVDHINGDRADNRLCNLRVVTKSENQRNAKRRDDNTSGATGVSKRTCGKFQSWINYQGKRHYLGTFEKLEDAIFARKQAEVKFCFTERHGT